VRFRFAADDAHIRGLRIIPEIPDIRLARLEGNNGIGKTLAARLLQLVSCEMPFAALPRAWESLVELLGVVYITIDGLREGQVIVKLDSALWRGRSQADCAENPGEATLAGVPVEWARLRSLIQVRRIAGDEGLAETLGRTIRERALEADAVRRRIGDVVEIWSHRLDALRKLSEGCTQGQLIDLREEDRQAIEELDQVQDSLIAAESREAAWVETSSIMHRVREFVEHHGGLMEVYSKSLERHENASEVIQQLESDLARAGANMALNEGRRAEVSRWARLLELRETAHTRARLQENQVLGYLGLHERPKSTDLRSRSADTRQAVTDAEAQLRTADLAFTIRQAAAGVENALAGLQGPAQQETIADLDRPISAKSLLTGVQRRRRYLEGIPRPGEALLLSRRISEMRDQLRVLDLIPELVATTDRKAQNVVEAEEKLSALMGFTGAQKIEREATQKALAHQRGLMVSGSAEAVAALARLFALRGAPAPELGLPATTIDENSEEQDEADLMAAEGELATAVQLILRAPETVQAEAQEWLSANLVRLAELGMLRPPAISLDRLDEARQEVMLVWDSARSEEADAKDALKTLEDRLKATEDRRAAAAAALNNGRLSLATAIRDLLHNSEWEGLRPAVATALGAEGLPATSLIWSEEGWLDIDSEGLNNEAVETKVAFVLEGLATLAEQIEDSAATIRDGWALTTAYLENETVRLARRLADAESGRLTASTMASASNVVLRAWTESEISYILSSTTLRNQLFDGADAVSFDLEGLAVQWKTSDGTRRRRPLEAFSSGQQVFAYTRAKLETLRSLRASSEVVVVFLDEFGAFVARDRFSELMRYVQDDVLGEIADQVVVMLPTSSSDQPRTLREEIDGVFERPGYVVTSAEPRRAE